ncbi:peptidoglycan-binding protein [Streptomyces sp. NPDC127069]|uniref:peptidoglycan-binding domain-containing protein n=1 Tax=Streptomyces sp. NPDC127069 TaxID=3347128 RepID=UPI003658FBF9
MGEVFGSGTEAAVKTVHSCSGLKEDGQVGPDTWAYLGTTPSRPAGTDLLGGSLATK